MLKPLSTVLAIGLIICLILTIISYFRKKPIKKYFIGTVIFFALFAAISPFLPKPEDTKAQRTEASNISAIKTGLKTDDVKAKSILEALKAVGYTEISSVSGTFGSEFGLTIKSPQTEPRIGIMLTDKDGKIQKIIFSNHVLYENDQPKGKIQDSIMGKDDKFRVVNAVERAIKKNAHDPSSVEMVNNQQHVIKDGGIFEARGQFRAKNGFGALTLHKYEALLDSGYKVRELREIR